MTDTQPVVVCGMGEVGQPLMRILSRRFACVGVDLAPVELDGPSAVLHICYPFQVDDFVGTTVRYIAKYQPSLTILNGTVAPGTTRMVHELSGKSPVAYSPVRGKHARMEDDLRRYKKFVAGCTDEATSAARTHFQEAGLRTDTFRTPEVAELAKLLETTWLGILIGWTQEMERFAARYDASFDDINAFIEEIDFLPSQIFPGHIGGHCVMPNIAILQRQFRSLFLTAIEESNAAKSERVPVASGGPRR